MHELNIARGNGSMCHKLPCLISKKVFSTFNENVEYTVLRHSKLLKVSSIISRKSFMISA